MQNIHILLYSRTTLSVIEWMAWWAITGDQVDAFYIDVMRNDNVVALQWVYSDLRSSSKVGSKH